MHVIFALFHTCGTTPSAIDLLCPRLGGIMRWSASVVRLSVRPSVCPSVCPSVSLMSRTSALTRKPKGLGRRNFAQGVPQVTCDSHTDFKVKSQDGAGAYCGGDLAAQLVKYAKLLLYWNLSWLRLILMETILHGVTISWCINALVRRWKSWCRVQVV